MRPRRSTTSLLIPALTALALALGGAAPATAATAATAEKPATMRVFSPDSFWYTKLPDTARLDDNSAQIAATMLADAQKPSAYGKPGRPQLTVNSHSYSPTRYVVDDSIPAQRVYFNNQQRKPGNDVFVYEIFNALDAPMRSVRVPEDALPAKGNDGEIIIYDRGDVNDPSDDKLVELWQLSRRADGGWQAVWGSAIENPSQHQGQFMWPTGATASGLPMEGGIIQYEELKAGRIDHVLGIAVPWATPRTWQFPANRTDGRAHPEGKPTVRQGQMLRIDPNLDIDSLNLSHSAKAIVRAGQEYGYVVWDTSPTFSFRAENPIGNPAIDYSNLFPGGMDYRGAEGFPWEHLQVLDTDYSVLADVKSAQAPLLPAGKNTVTMKGLYTHLVGREIMQSVRKPSKYNYHRSSDETYTLYDESVRDRFNEIWGDGVATIEEVKEIQAMVDSGALGKKIANTRHYAAADVLAEMVKVNQYDAEQAELARQEAERLEAERLEQERLEAERRTAVTLTLSTEGDAAPEDVRTVVVPELWSHFTGGPLQLTLTRPDQRYYHASEEATFEILDESIRAEFNRIWADRKLDSTEIPNISRWRSEGKLAKASTGVREYRGTLQEEAAKRAAIEKRAKELADARAAADAAGQAAGGVEGTVSTVTLLTEGDVAPYGVDTVIMPRTWSHFVGGPLQYDLIRPSKDYYHALSEIRYEILDDSIRAQFNDVWADRYLGAEDLKLIRQWIGEGKLTKKETVKGYHHPTR